MMILCLLIYVIIQEMLIMVNFGLIPLLAMMLWKLETVWVILLMHKDHVLIDGMQRLPLSHTPQYFCMVVCHMVDICDDPVLCELCHVSKRPNQNEIWYDPVALNEAALRGTPIPNPEHSMINDLMLQMLQMVGPLKDLVVDHENKILMGTICSSRIPWHRVS